MKVSDKTHWQLNITEVLKPPQIALPRSKSLSHRALVCASQCGGLSQLSGLSESDDTQLLQGLLPDIPKNIYVADAGTPARLITALACLDQREHLISGTPRMHQRPMLPLIQSLRQLGFCIKGDSLPLHIIPPHHQKTHRIILETGLSSQFLSALLLIGPALPEGLQIICKGRSVSASYARMTMHIMRHYGAEVMQQGGSWYVSPGGYKAVPYAAESDWSSAAVWYALVAVGRLPRVFLKDLHLPSWQGDAQLAEWGTYLGVTTVETEDGLELKPSGDYLTHVNIDFTDCPDLAIAVIYTAAVMGLTNWKFKGLETLDLKESRRLQAITETLRLCGIKFSKNAGNYRLQGKFCPPLAPVETYSDHRLAMATAILVNPAVCVKLNHTASVSKSYPHFWRDLETAGFSITPC